MKNIEIDLAEPLEKILETVLLLPAGCSNAIGDRLKTEGEIKQAIRGLYEAAHGRHVETPLGRIAIAPPAFDFLKSKPFRVRTQTDFLIEATSRLIAGSVTADCRNEKAKSIDDQRSYKTSAPYREIRRPMMPRVLKLRVPFMTDLPIHITTHHLSLSDSLRMIVRNKLVPVTRFANDAIAAEIVLRRRNGTQSRFSASARVALPGQDVHGHAVHVNLYTAIGKLAEKLGRLLRKRKTRLAKAFKHPGRGKVNQSSAEHR